MNWISDFVDLTGEVYVNIPTYIVEKKTEKQLEKQIYEELKGAIDNIEE